MKRPLVSIVILCHNDKQYLARCVASLRRFTRVDHEIIFVDNGSKDGVIRDLRRIRRTYGYPVKIIRNPVNQFFAGGNNQGMRAARGKHILLLNADTVVTPGWLDGLVRCVEKDSSIGLVGPYTNHAVGLQVQWPTAYRTLSQMPQWARSWSRRRKGKIKTVPWLIGVCLLISRSTLDTVGLLDDRFGPGGFEDYDYCLRVHLAGKKIVIAQDVYIHHFGGRGYVNMRYEDLRTRNRRVYWDKWSEWAAQRWTGQDLSPALASLRC